MKKLLFFLLVVVVVVDDGQIQAADRGLHVGHFHIASYGVSLNACGDCDDYNSEKIMPEATELSRRAVFNPHDTFYFFSAEGILPVSKEAQQQALNEQLEAGRWLYDTALLEELLIEGANPLHVYDEKTLLQHAMSAGRLELVNIILAYIPEIGPDNSE